MPDQSGRLALITGANSGLGLESAEAARQTLLARESGGPGMGAIERHGSLDLLLNNAGVMAPPRQLTRQGFELQFGVNHLGHFALTRLLLPLLQASCAARVVQVTSGAQYFGRLDLDDLQGERRPLRGHDLPFARSPVPECRPGGSAPAVCGHRSGPRSAPGGAAVAGA